MAPPSELERLVRYCHPAKILATTRLPGVEALDDRTLAALYGVPAERYRHVVDSVEREARDTAAEMLRDPAVRRRVRALRLAGPLVALGDSHTDDLGSWAEILRRLLGGRVLNAGLSGDTTTAALARAHRLPPPEHAVVLLGTNDARRHGTRRMLVSHRETRRNLRAIDRLFPRVTWITPPPVDEARIRAAPALREAGVSWRRAEVAGKAALVRADWPGAVDLWPAFGAGDLAADGLHPSSSGQRVIAELVLERLGGR